MKALVACEESQVVTIEFRKLGHEAYSCDIEPCSGGHPEWHIQGDVTPVLKEQWDMIIAFPPCTYLSNAGACRLYPNKGMLDCARYERGIAAKAFFMLFYEADCKKVAIENPISSRVFKMPEHTQEIQPYMFGHPYTKKTRLWLKGLPELKPTNIVEPAGPFIPAGTSRKDKSKYGVASGSRNRSKTFHGIAVAMAEQWGGNTSHEHNLNKNRIKGKQ